MEQAAKELRAHRHTAPHQKRRSVKPARNTQVNREVTRDNTTHGTDTKEGKAKHNFKQETAANENPTNC
jgi:hypothetical protein